jgi:hypothetical protein
MNATIAQTNPIFAQDIVFGGSANTEVNVYASDLQNALNDVQKLQGALDAGDATYAAIHASNLLKDTASFQTSFEQLIAGLQNFKQAVESNPSNNITIDLSALENLRQTIRQMGLPPELLNALQAYGFVNLLRPDQLQSVLFDTPLPTNLPSDLFTALDTDVNLLEADLRISRSRIRLTSTSSRLLYPSRNP